MKYHINVAIGYDAIFEDFKEVNPVKLISDIPSINSLEKLGYFIAQVHTNERSLSTQIEFLKMWSSNLPNEIMSKINDFISRVTSDGKSAFNFINNIAALILIEIILENYNDLEKVDNLTPEQELNLFKAYLWCNQYWTDKQGSIFPEVKTTDDLISMIFPTQLPYMEILEFKDFRIQFLKAIYFFKFCETNEVFSSYINAFIKDYNLDSWQTYLINILSLYVRRFDEFKTPSIMNFQDEHVLIKDFLNQFCLDVQQFVTTDDFNSIRKTPIYKIDHNNYLFLNLNFFVDKLFQGVQFEMFRVIRKNNLEYNGKQIAEFDQFRSIYAEQISEAGIFYESIRFSFEKCGYKLLDGKQLKKVLKEGEPDFYIRDKSKIYLFEYKDVIINAKVKHSYDFERIKSEISKKMVSNQMGNQKGIRQLFNSISNIKNGEYRDVDDYDNLENCTIYPIIVFTDYSFNLPGMNYYLNKEFNKLIDDCNLTQKHKIKDLTIIDLDTFLKFQDLFRDKKLKINNCLNDFISKTKNKNNLFDMIESFNLYIHNKTFNMDYGTPKIFMDEIASMIPKYEESGFVNNV